VRAQVNPARTAPSRLLAAEFRRVPFGVHSADLQMLLHEMRSAPMAGKPFLFISDTNREWALGRYSHDTVPVPSIDWSTRFSSLEEAEWYVFRQRWLLMFGEELGDEWDTATEMSPADIDSVRQERLFRSPAVLAYADVRGIRAGQPITFFVSSEGDAHFEARIVHLRSPDIGPIGPAFKETTVDAPLNGVHAGTFQPIHIGSCARIGGPLPLDRAMRLDVMVYPTVTEPDARTIAEVRTASGVTVILRHGSTCGLEATLKTASGGSVSTTLGVLAERTWTVVSVAVDLERQTLSIGADVMPAIGVLESPAESASASLTSIGAGVTFQNASLTLAASLSGDGSHHIPSTCFNGKLERPRLFSSTEPGQAAVAEWDFSRGIPTSTVTDISDHRLDGTLHNMPTRGVRGAQWTGDHLTWMAAPAEYGAIHFHDTDLADAAWRPTLTYTPPVDLPSGCYALRVRPTDNSTPEFYVPFFVRPGAGQPRRDVAFVVPTTTYAAYANMHLRVTAQFNEMAHGRLTVLDSTDFLLLRMPELGRSTYDVHRDGSPVVYSSMSRPVTNFRPTGRMYKLCLDLMIVDWLDAMGYDIDVVTEDDLDAEGVAAIAPYRVLLTGSHPEYTSRPQLDAYEDFLRQGGRLMYLGGNGFYSAAEVPPGRPDVVEVRRPGQDNLWRVNHAEAASSSSGLPTGMWRNIGRPENALTGVGFITQGFDACTYYVRSAASHDERVSWIFAGLEPDAVIGDFGILQGGAAGYEIDRYEIAKGSPRHSVVVASSSGHSNLYDLMVPSILDTLPDPNRPQDPIRADMVFTATGYGGAVFAVGSIAWSGSLSHNGYANSVSTVTKNVLDRFLDREPIPAREPT
jgi:N,N-dimethylformamidase